MNDSFQPPVRKMEFTQAIERQSLYVIATDLTFVPKWRGRLQPDHFNEPHLQVIFRCLDSFFTEHKMLPTFDMLMQHLKGFVGAYDNFEGFHSFAATLYQERYTEDLTYLKRILMTHMRAVDYDRFALEVAHAVAEGEYETIETRLHEIALRHTLSKPVDAYLSTEEETVAARVKHEQQVAIALPTPWPSLNLRHGGGFQPSSLIAIMGVTGSGKSIVLVNTGAHALMMGKVVYHFTFELDRGRTGARYDVCLTGATYAERMANPGRLDTSLRAMRDQGTHLGQKLGTLFVIEEPTGTFSMQQVQGTINDHIALGAPPPDVIILDYLSIMMPNDPKDVDMKNNYSKLKKIAEECRAAAMQMKVSIVTALQSNRGAADKHNAGKQDVADSYAILHVLDDLWTINQTEAEKAESRMRLWIAKARNFADSYALALNVNYDNMRISEDTDTTRKYNEGLAKMTQDAIAKRGVGGVSVPLPESELAGLESVVGSARGPLPIRTIVPAVSPDLARQAAAWGQGGSPI